MERAARVDSRGAYNPWPYRPKSRPRVATSAMASPNDRRKLHPASLPRPDALGSTLRTGSDRLGQAHTGLHGLERPHGHIDQSRDLESPPTAPPVRKFVVNRTRRRRHARSHSYQRFAHACTGLHRLAQAWTGSRYIEPPWPYRPTSRPRQRRRKLNRSSSTAPGAASTARRTRIDAPHTLARARTGLRRLERAHRQQSPQAAEPTLETP